VDLGEEICGLQPCLYTDVYGRPTMYASGRPAGHIGGDDSLDLTGKWLNPDGSSSYPARVPGRGIIEDPFVTAHLRALGVNACGDDGSMYGVTGFFDAVEERSGIRKGAVVASALVAGLTALLMWREPKYAGEIAALGAGGVALSLYVGTRSR
jgi:hypothetical protein